MGNLFSGSNKQTQNTTTNTGPSSFQKPHLDDAFSAAKGIYGGAASTPFYQGTLYAGMSDDAKATLSNMKDFATNTGLGTASQLSSIGSSLAGYAYKAGSTIDDYLREAGGDSTQANIDAATKYAANPYVDSMIDANSRDVVRNLNESTLPTLNRTASAAGGINSSRAGVAEGVARRGAEDRVADISASIRGDAYNRGLTLAQQDRAQKLNAMGTAASAYQGLTNTGISALGAGANAGYGAYGVMQGADKAEQADRQGQADADFARWTGEDTRATDLLQRYFGIIGSNQWGQSGNSTTETEQTQNPGLIGGLVGAATSGLGIAGGLGWKPFN